MAEDTSAPIPKREPYSEHFDMTFSPTVAREIRARAATEGLTVRSLLRRYVHRGLAVDRDRDALQKTGQAGQTQ
jgi:hypothetical protein